MSRSGYTDDLAIDDQWQYIKWRGQVMSAFRGKRGQAFLRDIIEALDALPEKKLAAASFTQTGEDGVPTGLFCTLGAVGRKRGVDMSYLEEQALNDDDVSEDAGLTFDIARAMAGEVMYENDSGGKHNESPEERWRRMRRWIERELIEWETR